MEEANIGENLRRFRRAKQITIVDLAKRMGVSQAYLVKVERGEIDPSKEQVELIEKFLV